MSKTALVLIAEITAILNTLPIVIEINDKVELTKQLKRLQRLLYSYYK